MHEETVKLVIYVRRHMQILSEKPLEKRAQGQLETTFIVVSQSKGLGDLFPLRLHIQQLVKLGN